MISLCQDVSISYEYHVYENKTIKKVAHKRNGSNISQKTFVKSSKLSLVSKNIERIQSKNIEDDYKVQKGEKKLSSQKQVKNRHKRSWSNHLDPGINFGIQTRIEAAEISQIKFNPYEKNMIPSPSPQHQENRSQVYFNRRLQQILPQQKADRNPLNEKFYPKPNQFIIFNGSISSRTIRPEKYLLNHKEKILKIQPYTEGLFRNHQQQISQKSDIKHTRSNSFTTYQTVLKQNLQNIQSSTVEDLTSMEKQFIENHEQNNFQLRQNSLKIHFESTKMINFQGEKKYKISPKYSFNDLSSSLKSPIKNQKENIFDAESTISKNLNDEIDSESVSVVQQRNFFFQKQEQPVKCFKKSIENLRFFDSGYTSLNKKWILYKNVQDKDNKKIYSVKQFPSQNEKQYLNEYQIYLSLKTKTTQSFSNSRENIIFLNLFNVLSSSQDKKLHLIKESFQYTLCEYIKILKAESLKSFNPKKFLEIENTIINNQIKNILMFFSQKEIEFSKHEEIEIQDFVVCQIMHNKFVVKFHSLNKLQKVSTEKLRFSKFSKLKKDQQKNYPSEESKQNPLNLNLSSIYKKIFNAFFCI